MRWCCKNRRPKYIHIRRVAFAYGLLWFTGLPCVKLMYKYWFWDGSPCAMIKTNGNKRRAHINKSGFCCQAVKSRSLGWNKHRSLLTNDNLCSVSRFKRACNWTAYNKSIESEKTIWISPKWMESFGLNKLLNICVNLNWKQKFKRPKRTFYLSSVAFAVIALCIGNNRQKYTNEWYFEWSSKKPLKN